MYGEHVNDGPNIHVIHDEGTTEIDQHEVGTASQVIQHITVENFGRTATDQPDIQWQEQLKNEFTELPEIINVFQNLRIKMDISAQQLTMVSANLVELTSHYRFYWFQSPEKCKVRVICAEVASNGQLSFVEKVVDLDKLNQNCWLDGVVLDVVSELRYKFFKKWWHWSLIDCVIEKSQEHVVIYKTEIQIYPDVVELAKREKLTREDLLLKRKRVLTDLKGLSVINEYQPILTQMIASVDAMESPMTTIANFRSQFKRDGISFRTKAVKAICAELASKKGYSFNAFARDRSKVNIFSGFRGIGRIKLDNQDYYFVGSNQAVKEKISRAIRLRRLIPLRGNKQIVATMFPDLVPMMQATFVRNGQYTVIPFMAKYLREYAAKFPLK